MSTLVSAVQAPTALPSTVDRSSQVSSAASFYTAPSARDSHTPRPPSSRSSSATTLGRADAHISSTTPIHIVTPATEDAPQEVHIIKVTDEAVHLQSTSTPTPLVQKVGKPFFHVVTHGEAQESSAGPPPPSPPASDGQLDEDEGRQGHNDPPPIPPSKSEPTSNVPLHRSPRLSPSSSHNSSHAGPGPSTMSRRFRADDSPILTQIIPSRRPAPLHTDGLLQTPPHASAFRSPRRNTIGSAPRSPRLGGRAASHLTLALDDGELSEELVSDMQQQAEQIRRERLSKRVKHADDPPSVAVGNLIGEGHVNYVLMYNMLTGIRIAVSRTQAKIKRSLTDEDFTARHKYSFDL